ncbi:MAG: hypothetical protein AMXMBFR47_11380 [Planctomycetota bacterium]
MRIKLNACRVCGWQQEEPPWGADGKTPSFAICSCCGVEFGYEDATPEAIKRYRAKWFADEARWFDPNKKPADWDFARQLAELTD